MVDSLSYRSFHRQATMQRCALRVQHPFADHRINKAMILYMLALGFYIHTIDFGGEIAGAIGAYRRKIRVVIAWCQIGQTWLVLIWI
jgi:hypothetical protein